MKSFLKVDTLNAHCGEALGADDEDDGTRSVEVEVDEGMNCDSCR